MTLERIEPGTPGRKQQHETKERNREMRYLRGLGMTLQEIGDRYGVSRQRAHMLVRDEPTPPRTRSSYNPWTHKQHSLIQEILRDGISEKDLGIGVAGVTGAPGIPLFGLTTYCCRLAWVRIRDSLMAAAYLDGATIEELDEIFGTAHPHTLTRLRAKGYNLPHRKCGTHWNISEGDTE